MSQQDTKILIVDDEEDFREIFSKLIARIGYKPFTAADGIEALELARTIQPDIAVIDYKMPRMNGIALTKTMKQLFDKIAILLITGYGTIPLSIESASLGIYDYITKPLDLRHVERQIRRILASQ